MWKSIVMHSDRLFKQSVDNPSTCDTHLTLHLFHNFRCGMVFDSVTRAPRLGTYFIRSAVAGHSRCPITSGRRGWLVIGFRT